VEEFRSLVYARPDYIATLSTSTAIADHVRVDFELPGAPPRREVALPLHLHAVERRRGQCR